LNSIKTAPREKVISQLSDDLITSVDLAEELGRTPNTIRKWTRLKIIPAIRLNTRVVWYDRADVRRALQKYRQKEAVK
jgi:uncharacterized protein YjcR